MKKKVSVRKKIVRLITLTIILLYIGTQVWPLLSEANNKTFVVQYGKFEEVVPVKAYIIRNEKVIANIENYDDVEFFVQEGSMVSKGQEIARIYRTGENDSNLEKELRSLQSRIDSLTEQQSQGNLFQSDINKINNQIESEVRIIQQYINNGEYERVSSVSDELNSILDKKNIISGNTSLSGSNIRELESQRDQLKSKLNAQIKIISSNKPGYFALGSDELENLFNLNNIEQIDFESFKVLQDSKSNNTDSTSVRIINDFKYNLVMEIDNNELSGLSEGALVRLRDTNNSHREYRARVRKLISEDIEDSSILILSANEHMEDIFTSRVLELDLLKNAYEGITVPNRSIIEVEDELGVFKVDLNGFVNFVPVKVKGQNDDYAIVYNSHFDTVVDGESKRVLTISSFDEIVINADGLNDGQKIR